jgi:3-methyl-2-oxobutanoate hydroxymethyltransferase
MSTNKKKEKVSVPSVLQMKSKQEKIAVLTAYDTSMAEILDACGIDIILVGDSAGMVFAGYDKTLPVTMEMMLYHTQAVTRGVKRALVVADMPFLSYQASIESAVKNAGRFLQEAGAEAVKLEGGQPVAETIARLVSIGIPVMGHLGLTPQSINQFGSYRLIGTDKESSLQLMSNALLLQEAGVFSIVLEKIPAKLAGEISRKLAVPTIGIGAGPYCDGQVLVSHDMLGIFDKFRPKFVRRYAEIGQNMRTAFKKYIKDVKSERFPSKDESY